MLLRMSEEDQDYEGKWPRGDAMTKPTVDEAMELVFNYAQIGVALNLTKSANNYKLLSEQREVLWAQIRAALESLIAAPVQQAKWTRNIAALESQSDADPTAPIIAPAQQAEPVAWVRNLTDPQPHCVTGLQYRTAADAAAGVQYVPVYLHPPPAEVQRLIDKVKAVLDDATKGGRVYLVGASAIVALRAAFDALEGK